MATTPYATVNDVSTLFRTLTAAEQARAAEIVVIVSDELRVIAMHNHRDLDAMITETPILANVAKEVVASVTYRILRQNLEGESMSQMSQSALGYSISGTPATVGGGIGNAIMNVELRRLGLKRQRVGIIDFYDPANKPT